MGVTLERMYFWRIQKTILTEKMTTLLFYTDLLVIITYLVMDLWDDEEILMMREYLKVPLSIRKKAFLPTALFRQMQNTSFAPLILGNSTYPLKEFIMKSYADRGDLNREEITYNVALSKSWVAAENVFGRLKGRFQCLSKDLHSSIQNTVNVVVACCTLHNVCELKEKEFFEDWLQNIDKDLGESIQNTLIGRSLKYLS